MRVRATFGDGATTVWRPGAAVLERSRLARAMRGWGHDTLTELHTESVERPEWFWPAVIADLGIDFRTPWVAVRDDAAGRAFPRWFPGATLNIVDSCVERHAAARESAGRRAITYEGDDGRRRTLTYAELAREVDQVAGGLRDLGIGLGDRVALFMPVVPEATVAVLACAKIGAVAVPAFSGYGPEPLAARLAAAEAVALFTVDATTRRGKPVSMKQVADAAVAASPSVRHVIVVAGGDAATPNDRTPGRDLDYDALKRRGAAGVETVAVDADHPLIIIYTSGTTGAPKGIVHSHAGFLIKTAIDFGYAFDIQGDDVIAWTADMGWMLGPLMIFGGLQFGAGVVFIEGVPTYPAPDRIWRIAERNGATLLGIAPTAARAIMTATGGDGLPEPLPKLRAFASTGEAWDEPTWNWLFHAIGGARLPILNYSGGTEVGGGILSCYTIAPQSPTTFSGPLLGMDVDVLDTDGERTDGVGELAIRNVWPGMAHGFWRDPDRYLETYWKRWPDIWVHGDLAGIDPDGFWRVHGRSDDTLKIAGRRVGPAEIESALVTHPGVIEAAAIGVPDPDKGQRIAAFVVLADDAGALDRAAIGATVAGAIGRALVPSDLIEVCGLPKTRNGKIMRRAIRARYLGHAVGELSALDPQTPLDLIPEQPSPEPRQY